jgi:hypothetical protein
VSVQGLAPGRIDCLITQQFSSRTSMECAILIQFGKTNNRTPAGPRSAALRQQNRIIPLPVARSPSSKP